MRYLVIVFGVVSLTVCFARNANAHQPHEETAAIAVIQLGGILLAIGLATSDIIAAIKRGQNRRSKQVHTEAAST